jgi:hypothetical protein
MNEKQALGVIKAILDKAVEKGLFGKMDDAYTAIGAFNLIAEKFNDEPGKDAESN